MAINNINNLANNRLQNTANSQGTGSKSVTSSPENKAATVKLDSVSLTSEAQQLQKMQQNLNTASTGNESKIERLKKPSRVANIRLTATLWPRRCSVSRPIWTKFWDDGFTFVTAHPR